MRRGVFKNISKDMFDGIGLTIVLGFLCIILVTNIVRVINKGIDNYGVYIHERDLLNEALEKNKNLQDDYKYYSQDETKKLLAREILNLGVAGETLYKVETPTVFYEDEKRFLDLSETNDYKNWWSSLIKL